MSRRAPPFIGSRSAISSELVSPDAGHPRSRVAANLHAVIITYAAIEFLAVACTAYFASLIYHFIILQPGHNVAEYVFAAVTVATLILLTSTSLQHFTGIQKQPLHVFLWRALGAVFLAFPIFLTILFLTHLAETYSRATFAIQVFSVATTVVVARLLFYSWLRHAIASNQIEARRVFLISDSIRSSEFIERLKASGMHTIGLFNLDDKADKKIPKSTSDKLIYQLRSLRVDDIILVTNNNNLQPMLDLAFDLSELPTGIHIVPVDTINIFSAARITDFGNLRTVQLYRRPLSTLDLIFKRTFDVIAATTGLVLLSPLFLVVSIAIKLDSSGPVFFRQKRHGFNNQVINVLKFRSMTLIEDGDKFTQAVQDDPRVTRVGRIIRSTNIDELPQLINVLLGDMSIVGPRPHATRHNEAFNNMIKPFSRRHTVKPGITGWAQVNGYRGATDTVEKMQRRIEYDLYYIDHWSFLFDVKIIMLTFFSKAAYTNAY